MRRFLSAFAKVSAAALSAAVLGVLLGLAVLSLERRADAQAPPCRWSDPVFTNRDVGTSHKVTLSTSCNGGILQCRGMYRLVSWRWDALAQQWYAAWHLDQEVTYVCGTTLTTSLTGNEADYPHGTLVDLEIQFYAWNANYQQYQYVSSGNNVFYVP